MKNWFVFCKDDLLLEQKTDGGWDVPFQEEPPVPLKAWTTVHNITPALDGHDVKTYRIDLPVTSDNRYMMCGLRKSFQLLPRPTYDKAGKCAEILYWDSNTKYCGVCGSGDEVLLVHARNFKSDFYGLVAGFVETGETLEEVVEREVMEETGIHIRNLRYFSSQPWPYPCGLMVGFFAEYDHGDIHLQHSELSRGGWFKYDALPNIPEKLSIARRLIDHWVDCRSSDGKSKY